MKPLHFALAVLVAAIWGIGFIAIQIGLESFPPIFFTALRSTVASLPFLLFFPRPGVAWKWLIAMGFSLGVLLTGLLYIGMDLGMPAGLSSLVLQSQAFFTVLLAAALLSERPTARQIIGMAIAFSGIGLIAMTRETGGGLLALGLVVAAAFFWGVFNILIKQVRAPDMLRLIIWVSVVPPLPLLALSWVMGRTGPDHLRPRQFELARRLGVALSGRPRHHRRHQPLGIPFSPLPGQPGGAVFASGAGLRHEFRRHRFRRKPERPGSGGIGHWWPPGWSSST